MDPLPISKRCLALTSPSYLNFGVSLVILLGILLSYLTQHYRIIARRSSEGISPYFVLLGTTSGTCAFANILVLPASRADLACCRQIGEFDCFAGILGILQVGLQWSCFAIILLLFLLFFPRATTATKLSSPNPSAVTPSYTTALVVTSICVAHGFATAVTSLVITNKYPSHLQVYANVLGIAATVLASIQYLPQLYTTWRLKHVGSLSIPMMCIQTPGSFLWASSLAARVGWEGWSTWFVYVVTGILQGSVLSMGVAFEYRNWQRKKLEEEGDGLESNGFANGEGQGRTNSDPHPVNEETPLLRS